MTEATEEKELIERTKKLSVEEGSIYSLSEGFGHRYITPYALAIGASNFCVGVLSSLPSLAGNFSQLFTAKVLEKESRKKVVFLGTFLQGLMWLLIIFVGVLYFIFHQKSIAPFLLVFIYTLLVIFGAFVSPAWNSWMKDVVTEKRGVYFAKRNRIMNFIILVSMLIAGFILDYFKKTYLFLGFVILFSIAFLARTSSSFMFKKMHEPKLKLEKGYYFSFWQFLKEAPKRNFGRFTIFVSLITFSTAIASPFFAVYMLKHLNFSYTQWITVVIAASSASLISLFFWGKFTDKFGNLKANKLCSFLLPLCVLPWLATPFISKNLLFPYLVTIEFFSGLVWAGFNLSSTNFIYDAVTSQRIALCIAYFNMLNGVGTFLGATLGGLIASSPLIFGFSSILFLFLLSGILRFFVALTMTKGIKEVREVEKFEIKRIKKVMTTLTPNGLLKYFGIGLKAIKPRPTS
ncbi:MAG: MFS transporter [Candidatus Pacearchaeota archaeon]